MRKKFFVLAIVCSLLLQGTSFAWAGETLNSVTGDAATWTADDFTYAEYSQLLYGCDYSRQFTVEGIAISGFSEQGLAKLEENKNLVLPSTDNEGNRLVGVASEAFKGKGLTSVSFPAGMKVDYDDTLTHCVTKRGNFVIAENAFANNQITSVYLPDGVVAVMGSAFSNNQIRKVVLPQSIWWIETMAFANNQITQVVFPERTDFQLEMHGWSFARNKIRKVKLPSTTAVVNKFIFMQNPGMEALPEAAAAELNATVYETSGVVYMYTDDTTAPDKDRIHTIDKTTSSTHSWFQKLIVNDGTPESQYTDDAAWNSADFTYNGTAVTGLSESGAAKRSENPDLVIPAKNTNGQNVTEIAAATAGKSGLFATEEEPLDTVSIPASVVKIGNFAFQNSGVRIVTIPDGVKEIGTAAFQNNKLTEVILPDSVTSLGQGAFATNKDLEKIVISKNLKEIPDAAFGCSDAVHYMTKLMNIEIPEGITRIGKNAFAGNNFEEIKIPSTVTVIDDYAFSSKNYLLFSSNPCKVSLPEGLTTIGKYAFRNKKIESIELPTTVKALPANVFVKEVTGESGGESYGLITKVIVSSESQYNDRTNFPASEYHELYLMDAKNWTAKDFTYGDADLSSQFPLAPCTNVSDKLEGTIHVVTGLSEAGQLKLEFNKDLVIPAIDDKGNKVQGVGTSAFAKKGITSVELPSGVMTANNGRWNSAVEERGDFFIGTSAFSGNELTELELPEGVIYIGSSAFKGNKLTSVIFPRTIFQIASQAFASNKISRIAFHKTTDFPLELDNMAFAVNELQAVQLPDDTQRVHKWTFLQNPGKEAVPEDATAAEKKGGVVYIYTKTDSGMIAHLENENPVYQSNVQKLAGESKPSEEGWIAGDFTYSEDGTAITGFSYSGKLKRLSDKNVVLPDESPSGVRITEIADDAFAIPSEEVEIGKYDFHSDLGLETVVLPASLERIGDRAFEYNNLTAVDLGGVKSIGLSAFHGNALTELKLPHSVTELGAGAFSANNITELDFKANIKVIPQGAFSMNIRMSHVDIPEGIVEIGDEAFAGARLESLEIPSSVVRIGRKAFHLHRITELTIPGTVKEIGESAFEGTYKAQTLTKLTLGEGIESIGRYAFKEGLLTSVKLPRSLKEMGQEPFLNNSGKDNDHVVVLTTNNKDHLAFNEGAKTHKVVYTGADSDSRIRYAGSTRYDTALEIADALKKEKDVDKFANIVVAYGGNYPDALSGGYLAKVKDAPVLLVDGNSEAKIAAYIKENLAEDGTVYLLGGTGVISVNFKKSLDNLGIPKVKRLGGASRYETNILILREAGVNAEDILVCSGNGYADSLAASAAGMPILLVDKSLTSAQRSFLADINTDKFYIIGGTGVVSKGVENSLTGKKERIAGVSRYETSLAVARTFFNKGTETVVLTYAQNFPDGLSGSALAIQLGAPLLLTDNSSNGIAAAKKYIGSSGATSSITLGGEMLISDKSIDTMFK